MSGRSIRNKDYNGASFALLLDSCSAPSHLLSALPHCHCIFLSFLLFKEHPEDCKYSTINLQVHGKNMRNCSCAVGLSVQHPLN